jgi:hypothetical protein
MSSNDIAKNVQNALNSGDTDLTGETFTVICTDPSRSAACPACQFDTAEWTEEEAMQQFATDYELPLDVVAIED